MPSSAKQLFLDGLAQLDDEQAVTTETINLLKSQLQNEVAHNVRLTLELEQKNHLIRSLMRDRNGEG